MLRHSSEQSYDRNRKKFSGKWYLEFFILEARIERTSTKDRRDVQIEFLSYPSPAYGKHLLQVFAALNICGKHLPTFFAGFTLFFSVSGVFLLLLHLSGSMSGNPDTLPAFWKPAKILPTRFPKDAKAAKKFRTRFLLSRKGENKEHKSKKVLIFVPDSSAFRLLRFKIV